jgi:formylglycine-generating enzyme
MRLYALIFLTLIFCAAETRGQSKMPVTNPSNPPVMVVDSIKLILVRGGTFEMGSNEHATEMPIHPVRVNSFYMGIYEVTQEQWEAVTGYNFSDYRKCRNCAVDAVSWEQVQEFLLALNKRSGKHFRLPTEAEWEYAARGGKYSGHYKYSGSNTITDVADVYQEGMPQDSRRTKPVGLKMPNELGIYDMSGNLMEWCNDWYGADYYTQHVSDNPQGPATGIARVIRGGYFDNMQATTNTHRRQDPEHYARPNATWVRLGFRVVCDVE